MSLRRLFCPALVEGRVSLPPEEAHHAAVTLRAKAGHEVVLFDGAGRQAVGVISHIERRRMQVDVARVVQLPFELAHRITLAVAIARAHRQAYMVEKCTELGVAAIWPVVSERGVSRPDAAVVDKWSRRAVEAAKQSGRAWVPGIAAPQPLPATVDRIGEFHAASVTTPDPAAVSWRVFLSSQLEGSTAVVWVGPEGGWTDSEFKMLQQAGAVPTKLGPTILRTETAAIAVCAAACALDTHRAENPGTG